MLKAVLGFQELPPPSAEGRLLLALQAGRAAEKAELGHSLEQDDVMGWGQSGLARPLSKHEASWLKKVLFCEGGWAGCGDNPL